MKKIIYRSIIFVLFLSCIFSLSCCNKPVKQEPVEQQPAPAPTPTPTPTPVPSGECIPCPLVKLSPRIADQASIGQQFNGEIEVIPVTDAGDVVVSGYIPEGCSYVSSQPPAEVSGGKLIWRYSKVTRGNIERIQLTLRADREGQHVTCFTVIASPIWCVPTMVGKPAIEIQKTTSSPAASLNQQVTFTIVVRNTGNAAAHDVKVVDQLPAGLTHESGQNTITFDIGTLEAGDTKTFTVVATAASTGRHCNVAKVTTSDAGEVATDNCVEVKSQSIEANITCDEMLYLKSRSNNKILIENTGQSQLTGVQVVATVDPSKVEIIDEAYNRGSGSATWSIPTMEPGERKEIPFKATSAVYGRHCIRVVVTSSEGLRKEAECCTNWEGIPAMLLEVVDDPDPVRVGDDTLYTIIVTNQGTKEDNKIIITATFPEGVDPVEAAGPNPGIKATITGKDVVFDAYERLDPKQRIQYTIKGRGTVAGDNRLKIYLRSAFLSDKGKPPVTEEESTNIY